MKDSNYHRFLRVAAVVFAFVLVFDSGLLAESTARVSNDTQFYLANAIGVGASVQKTELNQITAELTSMQRDLAAREQAIAEREIEVGIGAGEPVAANDYSTYILSSILFILLLLILLNYTLDYIRLKELQMQRQQQTV